MARSARILPISPRAPGDIPVGTIVAPTGTPGVPAPLTQPTVTISPTEPAAAVDGQLWYNTTTAHLLLRMGTWFQLV